MRAVVGPVGGSQAAEIADEGLPGRQQLRYHGCAVDALQALGGCGGVRCDRRGPGRAFGVRGDYDCGARELVEGRGDGCAGSGRDPSSGDQPADAERDDPCAHGCSERPARQREKDLRRQAADPAQAPGHGYGDISATRPDSSLR